MWQNKLGDNDRDVLYVAFNKKGGEKKKKDDLYFLLTLAVYWLWWS